MKKVTEAWLEAAADDLRVIEKIATEEHLTRMIAFHSQQCIEESLKAIIEEYEIGSLRIHNLDRLFELVKNHVKIQVEAEVVEMLDKLYIDARYPGDLGLLPAGKPTLQHADKFHTFARDPHEKIRGELEKKDRQSTVL